MRLWEAVSWTLMGASLVGWAAWAAQFLPYYGWALGLGCVTFLLIFVHNLFNYEMMATLLRISKEQWDAINLFFVVACFLGSIYAVGVTI